MSDKEELEQLKRTFEDFIHTSSQLQNSYERLKEETQLLSAYLSNILDNMNAAIMVFDKRCVLTLCNGQTRQYFPVMVETLPPVPLEGLSRGSLIDIAGILAARQRQVELGVEIAGESKWLGVGFSDFISSKGEKTGYIVVINDITELRKLQLKSQQEDRLRVMGELAAEVAHEIRNPLGSIELMVTLLQEDLKNDEPHRDILSRIRSSVNNMNHTVTNILLYTKEIHPEYAQVSIAELVDQAESMALELVVKKQVTIDKRLTEGSIHGDFELLKQCLANLLINAAQAVGVQGSIDIQCKIEKENNEVILSITDNGCGIPEEMKTKIFKPFFTTKNTGTGLGLAMVKRVIEAHSGRINFKSGPTGTTFIITLPH